MASLPRPFKATFADHVAEGFVIATDMTGSEQMEVVKPPFRSKNIVGGRTFVHLEVRLVGTDEVGHMIYRPSEVVFRCVDQGSQEPA